MDTQELPKGTPSYVASILSALEAQARLNDAHNHLAEAESAQIEELWTAIAALSNRVESITRLTLVNGEEAA